MARLEKRGRASRDAVAGIGSNIRLGIPVILPETQEQFVPQMVNLDAIGGVSFQKGCYPGQEIVARTQYLGKIKRRMYLANINGSAGQGTNTRRRRRRVVQRRHGWSIQRHGGQCVAFAGRRI